MSARIVWGRPSISAWIRGRVLEQSEHPAPDELVDLREAEGRSRRRVLRSGGGHRRQSSGSTRAGPRSCCGSSSGSRHSRSGGRRGSLQQRRAFDVARRDAPVALKPPAASANCSAFTSAGTGICFHCSGATPSREIRAERSPRSRARRVARTGVPGTLNPSTLAAPDSVTVSWSGVSAPSSHDWVGVYRPGDPYDTPLGRFYDNSCTDTAGTTALASGSCPFVVPNLPNIAGTYELRLFSNQSLTLLATSDPVTVSAGSGSLARAAHDARPLPLRGGGGGGSLRRASRSSRPFPIRGGLSPVR